MADLNLSSKIDLFLPRAFKGLLKKIINYSKIYNTPLYAVGGFTRDLILGVKNLDLDLVVEGDGIEFAGNLAKKLNGVLVRHQKFGTATIYMPWPRGMQKEIKRYARYFHGGKTPSLFKIDIASARTEIYSKPAMLPEVKFGPIRNDLHRRDFTINAMAISLSMENYGKLFDFYGGRDDIKNKIIRALHKNSFIDDPTRILRAIRFEKRFGFKIEPFTEHLIRDAVKKRMLQKTGKHRIRDEFFLMLEEFNPGIAIKRLNGLCRLSFLNKKIKFSKNKVALFLSIKNAVAIYKKLPGAKNLDERLIYLMALLKNLGASETKLFCDNFGLKRSDKIRILSAKLSAEKFKLLKSKKELKPSLVYDILKPVSLEVILFLMAETKSAAAKRRILNFLKELNNTKIAIKGSDLKSLGITPGPRFKLILKKVLSEKLNGNIKNKKDEIEFVRRNL